MQNYIIACLLACCSFGSIVAQESNDEYLEKARDAYDTQRYDDAITLALKVIDNDPENVTALWLCSASYQSMEIYSEAEFYEKKLTEYDVWSVYFNRGMLYAKQGYDEEAMYYLNESIELRENNPKAYNCRGGVHVLRFRLDEAVADLEKSIELFEQKVSGEERSKDTYLPYYNLGVMYYLNQDYDNAEIYYKKAIDYRPDALELLGSYEKLKEARDPSYKPSKVLMKQLIEYHSEAIAKNRWSALPYYKRGECYSNLGNKEAAKRDYLQALELLNVIIEDSPKASIYIKYRAGLNEDLGRNEEALRDYLRVLKLNPFEKDVQRSIEKLSKIEKKK